MASSRSTVCCAPLHPIPKDTPTSSMAGDEYTIESTQPNSLSGGEMEGEIIENETGTGTNSKRKKLWNSFKKKTKPKRWSSKEKHKNNGDPRMAMSQPDINNEANMDDVDRSEFDSLFEAAKSRRDDKMGFSDSDLPNLKDRSELNGTENMERPKSLSLEEGAPSSPTTTSPTESVKSSGNQFAFYVLEVVLKEGKDLAVRDKSGTSDPYVKFKLGGKQVYKSRTIYKNLNPRWDESFTIPVENISDTLNIKVYDYDRGASDDSMGAHNTDLSKLPHNKLKTMKLKLNVSGSHEKCGYLIVDFKLIPKSAEEKDAYLARKGQMSDKKNKVQSRGGVVSITLIEGIGLIAMDEAGTSDPYVKFRLANQKYKSKVCPRSTDPKWREQFDLYFFEDQSSVLEVTVWDHDVGSKDDFMGRCTIDLNSLAKEETHTLMAELEDEAGVIHMLLTISGTAAGGDTVSDLSTFKVDPEERKALKDKYSWKNSFKKIKPWDVGWLQVKVIKAQGLSAADIGGKSDPLCVLELVNARLQTHTIYKTLNPEWGKVFTFTLKDIHSVLELTVYDEDRNKSLEFLGKVAIPVLRIKNGERKWYTLKDKKLRGRAKGAIVLEMEVIYNPVKAAIRTFNPREPKYLPDNQKFSRKILMRNINRVKKLAIGFVEGGKFIGSCFAWENKARSACAFVAYVVGVYSFELYLAPIGLLMLFLKNYIVYSVVGHLLKDKDDDPYEDSEDEDDDEVEEDKKSKKKKQPEEKKSFKEKLQQIQEVCLQVQNGLGDAASMGERVKNTFNWTVPWLSWLLVIVLCIVTVVLYNIPIRYLLLAWGCNKFSKKLRNPNFVDNNELADYLSRVPSDDELSQYREIRPDLPASILAAKRKKLQP